LSTLSPTWPAPILLNHTSICCNFLWTAMLCCSLIGCFVFIFEPENLVQKNKNNTKAFCRYKLYVRAFAWVSLTAHPPAQQNAIDWEQQKSGTLRMQKKPHMQSSMYVRFHLPRRKALSQLASSFACMLAEETFCIMSPLANRFGEATRTSVRTCNGASTSSTECDWLGAAKIGHLAHAKKTAHAVINACTLSLAAP
jgi:hypothetical protein